MTTGHSAFAWKQDSYKNKRGDDSYKKVIQADGNYGNGNTNTAQVLKQNAKADKFSIVEQNGENSICTHPSETCTSQSNQPPNQSLSTLSRGVGGMVTAGVSPGPSPSTGSPSSPSTLSLSPSPFLVPGVAAPG